MITSKIPSNLNSIKAIIFSALVYIARIRVTKGHFSVGSCSKCQPTCVGMYSNTAGAVAVAVLQTFLCTLPV